MRTLFPVVLLVAACTRPTVTFQPTIPVASMPAPRSVDQVRILGLAPQCPYHELGLLDLYGGVGVQSDRIALQENAARVGADAIVIEGNLEVEERSPDHLSGVAIALDGDSPAVRAN
jgi:hypothetical protein